MAQQAVCYLVGQDDPQLVVIGTDLQHPGEYEDVPALKKRN